MKLRWIPCAPLRLLHKEGSGAVAANVEAAGRLRVWPRQLLHMLVAMLDKPKGGLRPVTLFAALFRVWAKVGRPAADTWKLQHDMGLARQTASQLS